MCTDDTLLTSQLSNLMKNGILQFSIIQINMDDNEKTRENDKNILYFINNKIKNNKNIVFSDECMKGT